MIFDQILTNGIGNGDKFRRAFFCVIKIFDAGKTDRAFEFVAMRDDRNFQIIKHRKHSVIRNRVAVDQADVFP